MEIQNNTSQLCPSHWRVVRLGDVAKTEKGKKPKKVSKEATKECSIPYVNIKAFERKKIDEYTDGVGCVLCEEDDFLMVWDGSRSGLVGKAIKGALGSTLVRINLPNVNHDYAYYFFQSKFNEINTRAKGVGIPHVDPSIVWNYLFPLPPQDEQKAIVFKLEELFSELDKSVEELRKTQQQLKVYRQAVLKWAFEGRLTNEDVKVGELPGVWKYVLLGNISEMCLGKMLDKQKNKGSLKPYLGNVNVRWGKFELRTLSQMKFEESEQERYALRKGDLVVCEGGEPGRCAIWKGKENEMMIQKALHRVRVSEDVDVRYVYYFFFFSGLNGSLEKYFTGTTIKHLTGRELKKVELPLPSLAEQSKVVQEIESRLSISDMIEETITTSLKQAEALRQSILKQAFEGKLYN